MRNKPISKVEVTNFPKKDTWDRLNIVATILALLIAFISLKLYFNEINKTVKLKLQVQSSYPFIFNEGDFSEPTDFVLSLNNKGNNDSHSLFFTIVCTNKVNISLNPHMKTKIGNLDYIYYIDNWKDLILKDSKQKIFTFNEPNFFIARDGFAKSIGVFEISIPKKDKGKIKIAMAYFSGDFPRKACVIYYDYSSKDYIINHFTDMKKTAEIWNSPTDPPS